MNGGRLPPERAPREKRGCRVLYLGNEGPAKGFDVFLRMAAELARRGVARPGVRWARACATCAPSSLW
jgi:hypothetical protein